MTEEIVLRGASVLRDGARLVYRVETAFDARRVAIIGRNGSGKSTFARLINGLVTPDEGTVTVHGLDTRTQAKELRRVVGFTFTNPEAQIVMPTVREDVAFSLSGRGLGREEIAARSLAILERYGLASLAELPAQELSGGQKQLLALCSVLVTEPRILVADEPTTLLDAANTRRISELLLGLPQQLLIVTHDLELAGRCDLVLLFDEGRLIEQGEPGPVIERYKRELC